MIITYLIIGFTCLISYQSFQNQALFSSLAHYPYEEVKKGQYYRLITGGFVHGSWEHLLINMYVLYNFGGIVEVVFKNRYGDIMGGMIFLLLYFTALIVSDLGTLREHKDNPGFRSVGASGVTSALVFIYVMFDPWLWFIFPPVPAIVFAVLYVVWSSWASNNRNDHIDHLAHLYGGVYGVLFMLIAYPGIGSIFLDRLLSGSPF
ncbi:MAG: membrane associated rhomboid family serine protease [Saprospiraceae bacterium]|jgi:membrane associated rhomboid family serine protease